MNLRIWKYTLPASFGICEVETKAGRILDAQYQDGVGIVCWVLHEESAPTIKRRILMQSTGYAGLPPDGPGDWNYIATVMVQGYVFHIFEDESAS